jgi:hypothetical protein
MAIWSILGLFGTFCTIINGYLESFSHFGVLHQEKSGSPDG